MIKLYNILIDALGIALTSACLFFLIRYVTSVLT